MIGYYVHHQGQGHRQRATAIAAHLGVPVTGLSSLPPHPDWPGAWVHLPRDDDSPVPADVTAGGVLHWAPRHDDGIRARAAAVVAWIDAARPDLFVVDVSVEIALLARLTGTPVCVVAMAGDRHDRPHTAAYDLADGLLAPWPAECAEPSWPASWLDKTAHVGAFSRFDQRNRSAPPAGGRRVLVLWGSGGSDVGEAEFAAARTATPGWSWTYRTGSTGGSDDLWPDLMAADVVVVHGGQNSVAEVAAARRPAVVVAQQRPHDEQVHRVRALAKHGLAVGAERWPEPGEWPRLLAEASRLGGAPWARWSPGDGAARAAAALEAMAVR